MGWISVHRQIWSHWVAPHGRIFTDMEVWLYLLTEAQFKDSMWPCNGHLVKIKRGQLVSSIRKLAAIFNMSSDKLYRLLKRMENDGMIERKANTHYTIITIVKYEDYQLPSQYIKHQPNTDQTLTEPFNKVNKETKKEHREFNISPYKPYPSLD